MMMRIEYIIKGTLELPDGSKFVNNTTNLLELPDGKIISVHPVIELSTSINSDDHRNLNYAEARDLDIVWEDYDRSTDEVSELVS